MAIRGSGNRLSGLVFRSRISILMFSMFAAMATIYVAGRLWQDAQNRVYLIKELDRITGQEVLLLSKQTALRVKNIFSKIDSSCFIQGGRSAISVDDTLKVIACREQQKKLVALEMELAAAREEGFVSKHFSDTNSNKNQPRKRLLAVIGILTRFGRMNNRDAIRKAWMPTGAALKKMEEEKGIVIRFVIGRSANRGDSLDKGIDDENRQRNDFIILDNNEAPEELPKKTKLFFAYAADNWDSEFFAKVNDDVYVNIDALGEMLATHSDKPRVYIGCMKSGEVFSEPTHKWYEPDWWKFGDGKSYFRHASGEIFVISQALAQFVSINRAALRTYAHDDVSVGSWFIGLDVKHIDESKFCCSSWSSGSICSAV